MKRWARALFLSVVTAPTLGAICSAADNSPGKNAFTDLLTRQKTWTMYLEYTDAMAPGERAQKMTFEYFRRDEKVLGRQLNLAFGGCEFELEVRAEGFSFPCCPPYQGRPSLSLDPTDGTYPFKSHVPRKVWLQPRD